MSEATGVPSVSKPGQKYRRLSRPGLSVLAQGEPMVWLAGGALALSLIMIFGLLGLILYQGLASFWPGELVRIELKDGSVVMGEIIAHEEYETPQKDAEGNESRKLEERWQYRVDNFEFQGNQGTYRWISAEEISDAEPTKPEWAMLFERTSLGRFIGTPVRLEYRQDRPISAEEEELATVHQFFSIHGNSLPMPEDENAQEAQQKLVDQLPMELGQVNDQLQELQIENSQAFVTKTRTGNSLQKAQLESDLVSISEIPDDTNVLAVVENYEGPESTWSAFNQYHQAARSRVHKIKDIAEHRVGESSRRQESARLDLRGKELQYQVFAESLSNEVYDLRIQLQAIEKEAKRDSSSIQQAADILGEDSAAAKLGPKILTQLEEQRKSSRERIETRLDEIEEVVNGFPQPVREAMEEYVKVRLDVNDEIDHLQTQIAAIEAKNNQYRLVANTPQDVEATLALGEIVRAMPSNQLSLAGRLSVYFSRWGEFLVDDPREANSEGGVFPAIWGTIAMTLIMSLVVVPFGVLAALYLREYATSGPIVSIIRISINNLAGVPSIVFGVFGYGFLILVIGAYIDGGPPNANLPTMPNQWWWLTAGGLGIVAFLAFLSTTYSLGSRNQLNKSRNQYLGGISMTLWIAATLMFVALIAFTPDFHGFYRASLPNPSFGKGCLLWASLTLALLTLPVVIVATEEALSAVPNSLREGSYGCGASKWQTIRRIVLPHALPGIMTGMILAMARGAGEVAPLMLVGVLKLAPELPIDGSFPFVHLDRSFMHLGFHIFDLGFQSPNSEAAKPMVFTTTLLLIVVIATLNLFAIWLRARLRKRFQSGQF